jgi:enoyl-CoA hydratase
VRKDHPKGKPMTRKDQRHFEIENREAVLIVRVDGGPHALFGPEIAKAPSD